MLGLDVLARLLLIGLLGTLGPAIMHHNHPQIAKSGVLPSVQYSQQPVQCRVAAW